MMDELLSLSIISLRDTAEAVTRDVIEPGSAATDANATWPEHSIKALGEAGLLGLHMPRRFGGHEQGLLALAAISETIARGCPSSALCYAMHCVGSAVIAAKATPEHEERYLRPIAEGRHITTLALSESGTGSHFYFPQTRLVREGDSFVVSGVKQFITNGGHADSYVLSTTVSTADVHAGEFSCVVLDASTEGLQWLDEWSGVGMRGNSSRPLKLENVRVPAGNLLGSEGDQIWYTFEVVAPYFLIAMAGTYLGLAQAALDLTVNRLRHRRYEHSGEGLSEVSVLQHRVAEMAIAVQRTRGLVYHAAHLGDTGDPRAALAIMMAKADAGDASVAVANEAMTLSGGSAYRENSTLSRLLRDARASHVMAPTTDILKVWAGRTLLGLPLL
jgi:alkylation response protein AidB-like acyl-CoA dehydrogenase